MKPSLICWICSVLTLYSVSSSVVPPSLTELPNEMQLAILQQFFVSQKFDFCGYVDWLAGNRWAWSCTDVGTPMLKKIAEEEKKLDLEDDKQRVRRQQILKKVRTFVRIRSRLPIDCTEMDKTELGHLAAVLESSYEECAPLSESPAWKKACMAGLFGRNTLSTLLEYLSEDFRRNTRELLLQTAFFVGDSDSVKVIVDFFKLSEKDMLEKVPEVDIVFSGSVPFLVELFKFLPNLMKKRLGLIREACSLNHLDVLTQILKVAKPVEPHEWDQIIGSLWRLEMFKPDWVKYYYTEDVLCCILKVTAQHGHLPIIRFVWPAMSKRQSNANDVIQVMMTEAGWNNHRSVLEFLLWHSGPLCMRIAQKYVNNAFEAAVGGGNVELMDFLRKDDTGSNPIAHGLGLITLKPLTLHRATKNIRSLDGIKYLIRLKEKGDSRFANFELVNQSNDALCMACEAGNYNLVEYLLCRTDDGRFVFPLTNPAVLNNAPLVNACSGGHLEIVKKLLERDMSGKYTYEDIDPCRGISDACFKGHLKVLEFLLEMKDGEYVLPKMKHANLDHALPAAIIENHIDVVRFLLNMKDGKYVLLGMEGFNLGHALSTAINWNRMVIVRFLLRMEDGKYVLPEMNGVNLTRILWEAIYRDRMESVSFLLSRALDGSCLLPGVKVTQDMLTIGGLCPEMTTLLKMHLDQQHINT